MILPPPPPSLSSIKPYLDHAASLTATAPLPAFYLHLHALKLGIKARSDDDAAVFVKHLLTHCETLRPSFPDTASHEEDVIGFADAALACASEELAAGRASSATARDFLDAALVYDSCAAFRGDANIAPGRQRARRYAAAILGDVRAGRTPRGQEAGEKGVDDLVESCSEEGVDDGDDLGAAASKTGVDEREVLSSPDASILLSPPPQHSRPAQPSTITEWLDTGPRLEGEERKIGALDSPSVPVRPPLDTSSAAQEEGGEEGEDGDEVFPVFKLSRGKIEAVDSPSVSLVYISEIPLTPVQDVVEAVPVIPPVLTKKIESTHVPLSAVMPLVSTEMLPVPAQVKEISLPPPDVLPTFKPDLKTVCDAQKKAKWAVTSLACNDTETAVLNLRLALALLTKRDCAVVGIDNA